MQIEEVSPEVDHRPSEARARGDGRSLDEAIANYIANGDHDPWTVRTARRIFEEDEEFFRMLGDR
jgi:hypothetical protein